MDFGLVSLDGLMNSQTGFNEQKSHGSEFLKQERSSSLGVNENDWRNNIKKSRIDDFSTMLRLQQRSYGDNGHHHHQQQHMLSFSSPKSDPFSITSSDYYHSAYTRNAGLMNSSIHGALAGSRGPFTPSQWMELEHQALIYKYINANVPIPSNLLIPIRKAFNQGFSGFSNSFRHNTLGWGPFHLGFAGNHDPEPGRCRRTDGKKWRCSRDAVADQKYCERHMNRGRHRSRKPVEGQTGHTVAGSTTTKVMPMASPSPALVVSGSGVSNNLNVTQLQVKNLQSGVADTSSNNPLNRISLNNGSPGGRLQDSQGLSMLSPTMNLKPKDTPFSTLKQHIPCEDSSRSEFGLISSDSLLNRCSYIDSRNFGATPDLNTQDSQSQDPLRHFIDDWPKNRSNNSSIAWPEIEETQIDRTQLSISIPMPSDFSPSSSSPTQEKLALSPLSLGVGSFPYESTQRQANWVPISWESSMGGPLGEVLNHTNSNVGNLKNASSALNLMTDGCDTGGLQMELSPTGVLQKTSFGSLSNSSTGSSPRGDTNMLGASFVNSASVPTL